MRVINLFHNQIKDKDLDKYKLISQTYPILEQVNFKKWAWVMLETSLGNTTCKIKQETSQIREMVQVRQKILTMKKKLIQFQ